MIRQRIYIAGQRLAETVINMYNGYTHHKKAETKITEEKVLIKRSRYERFLH